MMSAIINPTAFKLNSSGSETEDEKHRPLLLLTKHIKQSHEFVNNTNKHQRITKQSPRRDH